MSQFLDNAQRIFEAAGAVGSSGDLAIIITSEGAIHMVAGADSPLQSLQAQFGVRMIYRVNRCSGRVRVEGRFGSQSCVLETESSGLKSLSLLPDRRQYTLAAPRLLADGQ